MVDRDDTGDLEAGDPEKADGAIDVLPADEPVDWAGHVPARRVTAGRDPGDPADAPPDEADGYDPVGWVPAPRTPYAAEMAMPFARLALARARVRLAVALDVVTFTAACPECGRDSEWVQERQDTKVRSTITCPCRPG